MKTLSTLTFANSYSDLPTSLGTQVAAQPLDNPFLIHFNPLVAEKLELASTTALNPSFINIFSGNATLAGLSPLAMKYCGHQFGQYNPDLGDGRGLLLGEVLTSNGKKWDLHLKGSGKTPYSRMGDGRAVLRSSVREYLASAAMEGLGIATTHALAIIGSQTPVIREKIETAATLIRVAESHIRFGHFEYLFYTGQHGELQQLADYVIEHHFPALLTEAAPYAAMFKQICQRTATMIAAWQAVGFAHGVMNTDNMSILGLTFDYGPFGFIDDYEPSYICNHSDYSGRYAFDQQPAIALWNLSALGYALTPLLDKTEIDHGLEHYQTELQQQYSHNMRQKLGLTIADDTDTVLFSDLFQLLKQHHVDYTLFFRTLSYIAMDELPHSEHLFTSLFSCTSRLKTWLIGYQQRLLLEPNTSQRLTIMLQHNPKYILRNYLAQQAIEEAEQGNFQLIEQLITILARPFDEHKDAEVLAQLPPNWGKHLEISCSS
ncbi:YdiU family protein [Photobacterium kishitanii]|uniref:protein adenylyltransferase SelO n=1 Tax=Photobacterium kishitanii TaxID=318456 RepID=UPI0007EFA9BC|nr:YdiU family protein [Photobacterium kishitanii]OBU29147.1 hypothetical protein AYY22_01040 [Photobacterium kishitanii]PSW69625.1 YdiU family protein [Photobacterium kishitanii]